MSKIIVIVMLSALIASCYSPRYMYSPASQNIPLISKKNDLTIAGFVAGNSGGTHSAANSANTSLGMDIHSAYAVNDHIALMVNKYDRRESNGNGNDFFTGDSLSIKYKRDLIEMGGGYFTPLKSNNTYLQLFGGVAFGKFNINERSKKSGSTFSRFHKSAVTKIFIQPAIISGQQKNFTAAFSLRFTAVIYHNVQTDYSSAELDDYFLADIATSPVFFWEPAINFTFGFKKIKPVKFQAQTGFSVLMNHRFIDYRSLNFGVGVVSNFLNHHVTKVSKN